MSKVEDYKELALRYSQYTFYVPNNIAVLFQNAVNKSWRHIENRDTDNLSPLDKAVADLLIADQEMLKTTTDKTMWREARNDAAVRLQMLLDQGETR